MIRSALAKARPEAVPAAVELRSALARLEAIALEAGAPDLAREANRALESLVRDEICVVVLGSFNRGKTSLVNALLGEPVLPVGIVPVTSVATLVRYGPAPSAWLTLADGRRSPIDLADLPGYVAEAEEPTDRSVVSHVEVEFPADVLAGGLVLADTPGIGSAHADATRRAREFLPRVDAAIFVLSPDPPVSQMELDYLRNIGAETPHFLVVLTKTDLFPESVWRESAAYSRRAIAEALGRREDSLEIRPVAELRSPGVAPEGPVATAEDSGVAAVSRELRRLVEAEGPAVLRAGAGRRLRRTAESLLALLDLQEAALKAPIEKLESGLRMLEERIGTLRRRREDGRALLVHGTRRVVQALEGSLADLREEALGGLASEIRAALDEAGRARKRKLVARVDARIGAHVAAVYDDWRESVGLHIEDLFREETQRVAELVDGTLVDLREWVTERFGVHLPSPQQSTELVESPGFYYLIEGARPQLTIQALGFLLLPRVVLRRKLRRRAERLAAEELDRNAGRLRADVAYRMQETVRQFLARLEEHAAATEEALHHAVELAASRRHEGAAETGRELERIAAARTRLGASVLPKGA
ncbi:MAG: dynamin family protein [Gemmatimonadota bacterium]